MPGYFARGSVNEGETRAGVHVGPTRPLAVGGAQQVLIDGDKARWLPNHGVASSRRAMRWIVTAIFVIKQEQLSMVVA